jgi:hypothetical protein
MLPILSLSDLRVTNAAGLACSTKKCSRPTPNTIAIRTNVGSGGTSSVDEIALCARVARIVQRYFRHV